ncbi:restriction endonuclease subunit S [Cycloclasticus pugetii]|uniref:restriction endonuclease subunit S n=1 Tax=Cycloclasticus pugetii TaxID=34068 RepID=UPI003A8CC497
MKWPMGTVADIAEVISGYAFKSDWFGDGEDKIIRIGDLKNGRVDVTNAAIFNSQTYPIKDQFRIKSGDILMALSGATVGKIAIADSSVEGCYLNQRVAIVRGRSQENSDFLKYVFSGTPLQTLLLNAGGAAQPNLSPKDLSNMQIPLPPLEEQKRIAAILDKADAIRRKRQQAINLADEFLRSVFLDMFGDPVTNPKGWEVVELNQLIAPKDKLNYGVVQPGEHDDEGVPLVRSGDLSGRTPDASNIRRVSASIDLKHKKSRLVGNEILIACVGSIGKVGWVSEEMKGWNIARAVTRIPLKNSVNREYIYRYLQSPVVQGYFERETRAVAQPTLNVGKTPIALPSSDLQDEFLSRYSAIESYKNKQLKHLNEENTLFSALSQKAFSGEL